MAPAAASIPNQACEILIANQDIVGTALPIN